MGWKASCILVNERGPGYLGTMPPHEPARARTLIADLGLGPHRSRGMTTFDEGIYPQRLVVGAYEGAAIIGDPRIGDSCLDTGADPLTAWILAAFPQAAVLRVGLHSVVNLWGYACFQGGRLVRAYGFTADEGVVADEGDLLPEERPHFERSVVRDGERFFYSEVGGRTEEFDASAYGETLAFEVMGRFFGCPPDQGHPEIDPFELPMEAFDRAGTGRWWWPFRSVSLFEQSHRKKSPSPSCLSCGEKTGGAGSDPDSLCPACGRLLEWFRGFYADVEGLDLGTITAETTFLDLSADSLDYVHWVMEAEERFDLVIHDGEAERLRTVGDYLGYIRANAGSGKSPRGWAPRASVGSDPMWDREVDL